MTQNELSKYSKSNNITAQSTNLVLYKSVCIY